jgi:hypothetical protein
MSPTQRRRTPPPQPKLGIPVLELSILLAVITGGLSFEVDLGRLLGLDRHAARVEPPAASATAPGARPDQPDARGPAEIRTLAPAPPLRPASTRGERAS